MRYLFMFLVLVAPLFSQRRVDTRYSHNRIYAVVPMVGTGTYADPRRPAYTLPRPLPGRPPSPRGIIAYASLVSDDGQFALVEFVARDRAALNPILADPTLRVFERGRARRGDIEAYFRLFRRNFNLDQLVVRVP